MKVLIVGHRQGLARALEKRSIPYVVWSQKEIKNKLAAKQIIISPYPSSFEDFETQCQDFSAITHVIAGVESSVWPSYLIKSWIGISKENEEFIAKCCTDKLFMKQQLSQYNIPMTHYLEDKSQSFDELSDKLGTPFVAKPRRESGGRGVSFIHSGDDLPSLREDLYFEKKALGKEGSIESFIQNGKIHFSNITEYYRVGACNFLPASYNDREKKLIKELNEKVISSLGIQSGVTHLEYYLHEDKILFGEIALRPPGGYIFDVLSLAYEYNFWDLYISCVLGMDNLPNPEQKYFASSIIIHPGEGVIEQVHGLEKLDTLNSLIKKQIKFEIGDNILKRVGVGEDFGYLLLKNKSLEQLKTDIECFYEHFQVIMTKS